MDIYVLPTQEDQLKFSRGQVPENHFHRSFDTSAEVEAYVDGLSSLTDYCEYHIISSTDVSIIIKFGYDEQETDLEFLNKAAKEAYLAGLDDAEGFISPLAISPNGEMFSQAQSMFGVNSVGIGAPSC